ncbi:hypothetical protein [Paludisphaera borealis]|uniref:hypothetical protein n=1 Tax=Paludisphaera borealis TaxID=1387353 RepID=UPI002852B5B2|nr:hypothetical protein [Paludisphaera borealis]
MNEAVKALLAGLVGRPCCLQHVGHCARLSLGFGDVVQDTPRPRGEWQIGTYYCAWRVVRGERILCGSSDAIIDPEGALKVLRSIPWGRFEGIWQPTEMDVRIELSDDVSVDFFSTIVDDCTVDIFRPNKTVISFSPAKGWEVGDSDRPWNPTPLGD